MDFQRERQEGRTNERNEEEQEKEIKEERKLKSCSVENLLTSSRMRR